MAGNDATVDNTRRMVLAGAAAVGGIGLASAGWYVLRSDDDPDGDGPGLIGYGRPGRDPPGGTPMSELPPLEGDLTVYSGRGKFLVNELVRFIEDTYDGFDLTVRYGGSTEYANQIINEGAGSRADVFYSVNAGALGALADAGRTHPLDDSLLEMVREEFRTDHWIGTSGRARCVPYNTDAFSADDLPDDIMAYPDFDADLGWAPGYGSAQAFLTAMRLIEGEAATREWIRGIVDAGARTYPDEFTVCQRVADGEIDAGFTNHYYIQRVLDGNPGAPLATHFTAGDAGAVFNVAGAAVVDTADDPSLAQNFVRHLLSAEAQDFFARSTFEYPLIPDVEPIGDLPTIDELDVPDIDLTQLSDLQPTIDMMREEGVQF